MGYTLIMVRQWAKPKGDTKMMTYAKILQKAADRNARLVAEWTADFNDVWHGENSPNFPPCKVGDQLVEMIGPDFGSAPWIENWMQEDSI